jgi:hypothetical protein
VSVTQRVSQIDRERRALYYPTDYAEFRKARIMATRKKYENIVRENIMHGNIMEALWKHYCIEILLMEMSWAKKQ